MGIGWGSKGVARRSEQPFQYFQFNSFTHPHLIVPLGTPIRGFGPRLCGFHALFSFCLGLPYGLGFVHPLQPQRFELRVFFGMDGAEGSSTGLCCSVRALVAALLIGAWVAELGFAPPSQLLDWGGG